MRPVCKNLPVRSMPFKTVFSITAGMFCVQTALVWEIIDYVENNEENRKKKSAGLERV